MAQISMASLPALKDSYVQLKTRMDKAVEDFRKEMTSTRTGRASVHMLDGVMVEAYGSQMPLNQLANVSAPEPQLITVQPWDVSQRDRRWFGWRRGRWPRCQTLRDRCDCETRLVRSGADRRREGGKRRWTP